MSVKITTPVFRASYVRVWSPCAYDEGKESYGLAMIFDKKEIGEEGAKLIQNAVKKAIIEKWGPDEKKWPRNLRIPFRDADKEDRTNEADPSYDKNYVGTFFMNAKTYEQPGIVNANVEPIIDKAEFYSGCYARATVTFKAYDKAGSKGVGCYLGNLMKVKDGEPLGGGAPAAVEFAAFKKESSDDVPFE